MLPWLLNTAWMLKCSGEHAAFQRACRDPAAAQADYLRRLLAKNRDTWYGRLHRFDAVTDAEDYQRRVPQVGHADLSGPIERIANGETNVLTAEPVTLLEPTSGTLGEKLIPYTAQLRGEFQRGVAAWVADLFSRRPAVRAGRAYWSISPALLTPRRSPGGLPIGFDSDEAYLGRLERLALRRLLATPGELGRLRDVEAFRHATLLLLIGAADLSFVSIWSPTFLTTLLRLLPRYAGRLIDDLRRGTFSPPSPLPPSQEAQLLKWVRPQPRQAAVLRAALCGLRPLADLWPRLAVISCWADGAASVFLPELASLFPGVEIQPKGLLATEGFVSLPLAGRAGAALALRSHFFEFEQGDRCHLAHEVERGGRYHVLLTTGGGLYRYALRDEVEVVGFHRRCPLLRFIGKCDLISDLTGEKLAESHVRAVLQRSAAYRALSPSFTLMAPVSGRPPRYRLYLQGPPADTPLAADVAADLEHGLRDNPYYRHAVEVGQLAAVEVALLDPDAEPAWLVVERRATQAGRKSGDVKPAVLDREDWAERLAPLLPAARRADTPADTPPSPVAPRQARR